MLRFAGWPCAPLVMLRRFPKQGASPKPFLSTRLTLVPPPVQELAQLDYECLRYKPSKLAAAAMLVAHAHVSDRRRMAALSTTSGYSTSALKVGWPRVHMTLQPYVHGCNRVPMQPTSGQECVAPSEIRTAASSPLSVVLRHRSAQMRCCRCTRARRPLRTAPRRSRR